MYQSDCDTAADARGLCFFTGMNSGGSGMTLASYVNNSAAGAGKSSSVLNAITLESADASVSRRGGLRGVQSARNLV